MSVEVERYPLHTREVICQGFQRSDGLYEFEGRLLDHKAHDVHLMFKVIPAGEPVHRLRVVMVVDDDWMIHSLHATSESVPTPYCAEIARAYDCLTGLRIGRGFKREILARLGGEHGCTHLTDLVGALANTVFQTLMTLKYDIRRLQSFNQNNPMRGVMGTCHAYRQGGPVAQRLNAVTSPAAQTAME